MFRYLPFVAGCVGIYWLSSMSKPPVPEAFSFPHADKFIHAAAYAALCGLALWGTIAPPGRTNAAALGSAWLLTVAYGGFDEVHQSFVVGREMSGADFVADAVGAGVAVLCLGLWLKRRPAV